MINLDEAGFRMIVYERNESVVVEFHAAWCPFGALLGPKLRRLEKNFGPRWQVARFDVVGAEAVARELGVEYVPALAIYSSGIRRGLWFGDPPMSAVIATIENQQIDGGAA